jgi:MFS family permease
VREVVRSAPLGAAGASLSGFSTGAALGFGAVYATRAGFGVSGASQFVASLLVGAVLGQFPLGRWSDRTDRRIVMATAAVLVAAGAGVGVVATLGDSLLTASAGGLLIGAGAFSLYGLSFAHVADYVDADLMPATGAKLITFNGLVAAVLPFVAYAGVRLRRRRAVSDDRRAHYAPLATSATVAVVDEMSSEVSGVELEDDHEPAAR